MESCFCSVLYRSTFISFHLKLYPDPTELKLYQLSSTYNKENTVTNPSKSINSRYDYKYLHFLKIIKAKFEVGCICLNSSAPEHFNFRCLKIYF